MYTGHDQEDQCIYKFVSSGTFSSGDREANMTLISERIQYTLMPERDAKVSMQGFTATCRRRGAWRDPNE